MVYLAGVMLTGSRIYLATRLLPVKPTIQPSRVSSSFNSGQFKDISTDMSSVQSNDSLSESGAPLVRKRNHVAVQSHLTGNDFELSDEDLDERTNNLQSDVSRKSSTY
jgi:hypothetical protein